MMGCIYFSAMNPIQPKQNWHRWSYGASSLLYFYIPASGACAVRTIPGGSNGRIEGVFHEWFSVIAGTFGQRCRLPVWVLAFFRVSTSAPPQAAKLVSPRTVHSIRLESSPVLAVPEFLR